MREIVKMNVFKKSSGLLVIFVLILFFLLISCRTNANQSADSAENTRQAEQEITSSQTDTQVDNEVQIEMKNIRFDPDMITVKAGTKITWVNSDSIPHTVTSGKRDNESGLFDSGNINSGGNFSYTFNEKGTFDYFCKIHPGMKGAVVVE
jgi:plastocyanin